MTKELDDIAEEATPKFEFATHCFDGQKCGAPTTGCALGKCQRNPANNLSFYCVLVNPETDAKIARLERENAALSAHQAEGKHVAAGDAQALIARMRERARIRRGIPRAEKDRIAEVLEEASTTIESLSAQVAELRKELHDMNMRFVYDY